MMNYQGIVNDYVFDGRYSYLGVIIVLFIIINRKYFKTHTLSGALLSLIFLGASLEGPFDLSGILSPSWNRLLRDVGMIVFLLLNSPQAKLLNSGSLLLVSICFFSFIISDSEFFQVISFLRRVLWPLLWIEVIRICYHKKFNLHQIVACLLYAQMIAYFIKGIFFGVTEYYVGTMSLLGGSATTILVLCGVLFETLQRQGIKKWALILLWVIVGLIGNKRGLVLYVPLLVIAAHLENNRKSLVTVFRWIAAPLTLIMMGALMISLTPDLNREGLVGGSIDPQYAFNYAKEYFEYDGYAGITDSRTGAYAWFLVQPIEFILTGLGIGSFIPPLSYAGSAAGEVYVFETFGLGYGVRSGFLWVSVQAGALFGAFYFWIMMRKIDSRNEKLRKGLILIWCLDFLTYSNTLITPCLASFLFLTLNFLDQHE